MTTTTRKPRSKPARSVRLLLAPDAYRDDYLDRIVSAPEHFGELEVSV